MRHEDDTPLSKEELELAEKGEALVAAAVAGVEAPQSLREAIERDRTRAQNAPAPFWRRRRRVLAGAAVALAVLAVMATALRPGGGESEPSLAGVEAAVRAGATAPAPDPAKGEPPVLAASVGSLDFPDWQQSFDWRASGRRKDRLAGRAVTTVYYRNPDGAELGYAVVSGEPLAERPPGRQVTRAGNAYTLARGDNRTVVTWVQDGHTCMIVASAAVPASKLIELAASRNA